MTVHSWEQSDWWKSKEEVASACRTMFDFELGSEGQTFGDCMALLLGCFDEDVLRKVTAPGQKVALAVLGSSYQALISVWQDLSEGRLASTTDHWRSVAEAPDYILAMSLNEDLARAWADPNRQETLKPERARRIVRQELNTREAGKGDEWEQKRQQDLKALQPYSHVSSDTAGLAILKPLGAKGGHFVTPEGRYAPDIKEATIYSAQLARQLVGAVAVAFSAALSDKWKQQAADIYHRGRSDLDTEYRHLKSGA